MKTVATFLFALLSCTSVHAADVKAGALKTPVSSLPSLTESKGNGNDRSNYAWRWSKVVGSSTLWWNKQVTSSLWIKSRFKKCHWMDNYWTRREWKLHNENWNCSRWLRLWRINPSWRLCWWQWKLPLWTWWDTFRRQASPFPQDVRLWLLYSPNHMVNRERYLLQMWWRRSECAWSIRVFRIVFEWRSLF